MRHTRCLLALVVWALASCSDGLSAPPVLNGRWIAVDELPGMGLTIVLLVNNGTVTGSGSWEGEAILGGAVSATGSIDGRNVTLDMTFNHLSNGVPVGDTFSEHFVGAFTSPNDLKGTTTGSGLQGTLHLQRLTGP